VASSRTGTGTAGFRIADEIRDGMSMSLIKNISFTERLWLQIGAQVANLFNHPNYAPPGNLNLSNPGFGQNTNMQTAEGAGLARSS
jgi:hypothetical protein